MKPAKKNLLVVTDKFFVQHRDALLEAVRHAMQGWWVSDIAHASGLSATTIYNMRSGKVQNPNSRTLLKLMYCLGLDAVVAEGNFKLRLHKAG